MMSSERLCRHFGYSRCHGVRHVASDDCRVRHGKRFRALFAGQGGRKHRRLQGRGRQVCRSLVAATRNRRSLFLLCHGLSAILGGYRCRQMRTVGCVARRCAFHIVGLLYRTICFRLQPVLQALPCDHAGSGGISCECGIPAPHVCACHRWRHVAFEPVRAPDQDQRPVRPHPFQPVQRHLD